MINAEKIKGVLFDYDGVLADTMTDNLIAWQEAFLVHGVEIKKQDYFPLEGLSPKRIAEELSKMLGVNHNKNSIIVKTKEDFYAKNNNFCLYEGVEELIHSLKKRGLKLAVVSGSSGQRLSKTTPKEFLSHFDTIITADSVTNPKPSPEPYQKALTLLGLLPQEAVVVENAPLGIQSAKSADIYCIAICTTLDRSYLSDANHIVNSFKDLKEIFNDR